MAQKIFLIMLLALWEELGDYVCMNRTLRNRYFYIGITVVLALIFLLQNNRPVTIEFFFWTLANTNMLLLLLLFFFLGGVVGFFSNQVYRAKRKSRNYKRELAKEKRNAREGSPEGAKV